MLGAGLIAGAIQLPALLPGRAHDGGTLVAPASVPSVIPSAPLTPIERKRLLDAYFAAGYDYDDALELAQIWKSAEDDVAKVKAEAGRRLLAGETLPIPPGARESAMPEADPAEMAAMAAMEKFFAAGYVYEDAQELARMWKLPGAYEAKVEAGRLLQDGEELPIAPKPENVAAAREALRAAAFFEAGYDYDDAVQLADMWKLADPFQAKIEAGKRLLAGDTLPIKP